MVVKDSQESVLGSRALSALSFLSSISGQSFLNAINITTRNVPKKKFQT
jgi:hypothetical protein